MDRIDERKRARWRAIVVAATMMVGGFGLVAVARAPRPTSAGATTNLVALYQMNEGSQATVMLDAGPLDLHGEIGDDITRAVRHGGATGYEWEYVPPDAPPERPGRLATVPASQYLQPGRQEFAVELRYRTIHRRGNIVQKGQSQTPGGFWKIEHDGGVVSCVFNDSENRFGTVTAPRRTDDGEWHVIRCERGSAAVRMWLDGVEVDRVDADLGSIANGFPLTIGGKVNCNQRSVGCDYFSGGIDYVRIEKDVSTPSTPEAFDAATVRVQARRGNFERLP